MTIESTQQQIALAELHDHPQQASIFSDISESELKELAEDMQERGQQDAIHCLPDGTLISGHQRVRAARSLSWDTISAVVRHDLGAADSPAVVEHLIQANLQRRHMDDLAIARSYQRLKQIELATGRTRGSGKVRDAIAARLPGNHSGRTLDRLERLLELPRDIQDMISAGSLTKSNAEKILQLTEDDQQIAYERLRDGVPVSRVLADRGLVRPSSTPSTAKKAEDLIGFLADNLDELQQHLEQLDRLQVRGADVGDVLQRASTFFAEWRDRNSALAEQSVREMAEMIGQRPRRIPARMPTNTPVG